MPATVAQITNILEQLAPPLLAEEWDNVGLQIGDPRRTVRRIWIALDPTPKVVSAACKKKVDLLITHHPLIFRPLKSIDFGTPGGSVIQMATKHQLAIYSAHTNLDIVREGVNDILAQRLGLQHTVILQPVYRKEQPREGVAPLSGEESEPGMGRIGSLDKVCSLDFLVSMVKEKLKLDFVKVAGDPALKVSRVALCSGSGASLMPAFLASEAQVYISGDIHYHDAREAEDVDRAIIDIGHFPSEHLMVDALAKRLNNVISKNEMDVEIMACTIEKDPFRMM